MELSPYVLVFRYNHTHTRGSFGAKNKPPKKKVNNFIAAPFGKILLIMYLEYRLRDMPPKIDQST